MNIYDRISKMADEPGTYDEKMYRILTSPQYTNDDNRRSRLGEGVWRS